MINIYLDLTGAILSLLASVILLLLSLFSSVKSTTVSDVFIILYFAIAVLVSLVWVLKISVL